MRDKLTDVIAAKLPLVHLFVSDGHYQEASAKLADAIREYLGSDEVVARVAQGLTDEMGFTCTSIHARAALSSILSEPYETSGWSEVVEDEGQP